MRLVRSFVRSFLQSSNDVLPAAFHRRTFAFYVQRSRGLESWLYTECELGEGGLARRRRLGSSLAYIVVEWYCMVPPSGPTSNAFNLISIPIKLQTECCCCRVLPVGRFPRRNYLAAAPFPTAVGAAGGEGYTYYTIFSAARRRHTSPLFLSRARACGTIQSQVVSPACSHLAPWKTAELLNKLRSLARSFLPARSSYNLRVYESVL